MADPEKILKVSVVTPDGIVYSHNAIMVATKAINGERTVMYDHLPIVTPLVTGEIRVKRTHEMNDHVDHITVNDGYVRFSNNEATVIIDSTGCACNVDVERAQSAKKHAEQHMQGAKKKHNEREILETEITLRRTINRLHVHESYGR